MATILIDDRERDKATGIGRYKKGRESIINYFAPYVEKYCAKGRMISAQVQHLAVSDYAIMLHNQTHSKLVMAIERKTWSDLSASIEGRLNGQIEAMKELREKEKCDLLIIMEGPKAFPSKTTMCARKPYGNLFAKLRHLLLRDKIPWVISKNQAHTAEIICDFASDYISLTNRGDLEINFGEGKLGGIPENLTKKKENSDDVIIIKMWCGVSGIHEYTCSVLRKKYKLAELFMGEVPVEEIAELRYADGVKVGERRAKGIIKAVMNQDSQIRALSEIPGLSRTGAKNLIEQCDDGLLGLFFMDEEEIADLQLTEKKRVGPKLSVKIRKFMDIA